MCCFARQPDAPTPYSQVTHSEPAFAFRVVPLKVWRDSTSENVGFCFLHERVIQQNLCFPWSPDPFCVRQLIYHTSFDLKLIMVPTVRSGVTPSFCSGSSLLFLWGSRCIVVCGLFCCSCWAHGLVFPETVVSSFTSETESVRELLPPETFFLCSSLFYS